jgi:phenylpropionate dioxygenase-like ring-hydroxylating dioxygenase large terminal subunit
VPDGKGKASKIGLVCPYHAWTYDFNGKLKFAPGTDETKDFDEDSISLHPVRLDTFCGFVFICHSSAAKPLAEAFGDLPEKLPQWFGPEGFCQVGVNHGRQVYDVPCNWKFLMENTCETYHTSVVHKGSLGPMKSCPIEPHHGDWDAVRVPSHWRSVVPLPDDFDGQDFPLPAFAETSAFVNVFPSLQFNVTWDCMWWMHLVPTGEMSTRITMGFVFPPETIKLDYFPDRYEVYRRRWHLAVQEDNAISLNQQRGIRSIFRKQGRFAKLEFGTHNFNNWLLAQMLDGQVGRWDPGQRSYFNLEQVFSNDSAQMVMLAEEAEKIQQQHAQAK